MNTASRVEFIDRLTKASWQDLDEQTSIALKQLMRHRRLIATQLLKCDDENNSLVLEDAYEMYNQQIKALLSV